MAINKKYWEKRYQNVDTPWNVGKSSKPLEEWLKTLKNKEILILIPGAGNAWEAAELWNLGFKNVFVLDWAKAPLEQFHQLFPEFPSGQLLHSDFFEHTGAFDVIVEQTFFCALPPEKRQAYAEKMQELLKPGGLLCGVMFNFPLTDEGPPFGGSIEEYKLLFEPFFEIEKLEACYNSEPARMGRELFVKFRRK